MGTGSNNQNQGSSGNGGFNNFGSNQGTSNNGGFDNQGSNQWPSSNSGGFGNNQGSLGSGINTQNVQRPQTTQRTPLNQISLQTTINDGDCLRGCRNRLTQQYNPICGSDNISYSNRQVFDCYQRECRQGTYDGLPRVGIYTYLRSYIPILTDFVVIDYLIKFDVEIDI